MCSFSYISLLEWGLICEVITQTNVVFFQTQIMSQVSTEWNGARYAPSDALQPLTGVQCRGLRLESV